MKEKHQDNDGEYNNNLKSMWTAIFFFLFSLLPHLFPIFSLYFIFFLSILLDSFQSKAKQFWISKNQSSSFTFIFFDYFCER